MANFLLIFGWIVVPVISIILTWYYSQEIPKGLPDDQLTGLLVSSFGLDTLRFLVRKLSAVYNAMTKFSQLACR